jgi:hypothetical protein
LETGIGKTDQFGAGRPKRCTLSAAASANGAVILKVARFQANASYWATEIV